MPVLTKISTNAIADNSITQADLGTMLSTGNSAPANPFIGQQWFKSNTGVTYQRMANVDGTTFWLDISSGGIGTSAGRGVDYVGDVDPPINHNGGSATLAVGQVYYNITRHSYFVCTNATNNGNVWAGTPLAAGGTITNYTGYKVHTFLSSGTFTVAGALNVDYLVVAGGGAGANWHGGGGGAGGVRTGASLSLVAQNYTITVGPGGTGGAAAVGTNGSNSVALGITATGGGRGGKYHHTYPSDGGSGAGGNGTDIGTYSNAASGIDSGSSGPFGTLTYQGHDGGNGFSTGSHAGGGGGGAGAVGATASANTSAGAGGVGIKQVMGLSVADSQTILTNASAGVVESTDSNNRYLAGGGGGGVYSNNTIAQGGLGGGGNGNKNNDGTNTTSGIVNTGGGGGGAGGNQANQAAHSAGGSGIVIIRYAV